MRLPLCPTQCHVQVLRAITNLNCYGNWFSPIFKVNWPDFYIFNNVTGQKMLVPETVELSIFQYFHLKRLIGNTFFIHIYISHNGLLQCIDPNKGAKMLDSGFH